DVEPVLLHTDKRAEARRKPPLDPMELIDGLGHRFDAPYFQVEIAFRDNLRRGCGIDGFWLRSKECPSDRSKKADGVILHAITLEIACHHLFVLTMFGRVRTLIKRILDQRVDTAMNGVPVLPRHCFAKSSIARDVHDRSADFFLITGKCRLQ